uniref:Uncharacterized protein n=1 Tax=Brassica campestris TaxID=3711 RepID=M4EKY6_BRACM
MIKVSVILRCIAATLQIFCWLNRSYSDEPYSKSTFHGVRLEKLWDAIPLLQTYGRRAPSGGQVVEKDPTEAAKEDYEITENITDIDPLGNRVIDDVFKRRRTKEGKLKRLKVITSRGAVDTTEAMPAVIVNARYFQDHTATSYLNKLIRHGQLLTE